MSGYANKLGNNTEKCKVLHVGRTNPLQNYTVNGISLAKTENERNIGVIISNTLKPTAQCAEASRRAGAVLTQISMSFLYRDRKVFLRLYKQFVRCHLEFAIPAWAPWAAGDMDILEKVQKRAINLITGLKGRTYEEKLEELGLTTLRERRTKFDLVETYKTINGLDRVDRAIWFNFVGQPAHMATRNTTYSKNLVSNRA